MIYWLCEAFWGFYLLTAMRELMVDYYKVLGVKPSATASEIKSAYRRLARSQHPDVNHGSPTAAGKFTRIVEAYRILSDPVERMNFDRMRARPHHSSNSSVFSGGNLYATRMRRAAAQARWDRAVDFVLEAERRENMARTEAVFTTVTLFMSTFMVVMLKPRFWEIFDVVGRIILFSLFAIGMVHLCFRIRVYLKRYTYDRKPIPVSEIKDDEQPLKPYSRHTAYAFLFIGYIISVVAGLIAGEYLSYTFVEMSSIFDHNLHYDLLFYPPIAVLIIDTMHSIANRIDRQIQD